jgi:hypothetical protein
MVEPETLRKLLRYKPLTGELFWRRRASDVGATARWNGRNAGKPALACIHPNGHRYGAIFDRTVKAHRVIWAIVHGEWPDGEIDHINGIASDNRLSNLRIATRSQNLANRKAHANRTSSFVGVSWAKRERRWRASIYSHGVHHDLGYFRSEEDAARARDIAAISINGEFARINLPEA